MNTHKYTHLSAPGDGSPCNSIRQKIKPSSITTSTQLNIIWLLRDCTKEKLYAMVATQMMMKLTDGVPVSDEDRSQSWKDETASDSLG